MTTHAQTLNALSQALADTVEQVCLTVVAVNPRTRIAASGILWRPDAVVTAEHILKRDEDIAVGLPDGSTVSASLAGRDPGTDLAVLRLPQPVSAQASVIGSDDLKVGHLVLAVARPDGQPAASLGVVGALGGAWRTWRGGQLDRFIRLDLNLYAGFSGAALASSSGQVLGLVTGGLSRSGGIAIPSTTIERVVNQLLATGVVERGYLGIGMQPVRLPEPMRTALGLAATTAVIVVNLEAGGPAERAGVLIGDVLLAIDGVAVSDTEDVLAVLTPERVERTVPVQAIRGGQPVEMMLTIGRRPRRSA